MKGVLLRTLLLAFLGGWAGYGFSLHDVGSNSISVLLLAAAACSGFALRTRPRMLWLILPIVASAVVSYLVTLQDESLVGRPHSHLLQQLLGIGVMLGAASIRWERELPRFRWALMVVATIVLVYGVYQFFARRWNLPWAFLEVTNLQYGNDGGAQRGFTRSSFIRVSSFFIEPSDLGRYMLWVLCFALTEPVRLRRLGMLFVASVGIVLSQSLGAVLGALVIFVVTFRHSRNVAWGMMAVLCLLGVFLVAQKLFPEELRPFNRRVQAALALDESADSNRIQRLPHNLHVYQEAPWLGHGMGTNHEVEPYGVAIGYMLLLIERGLVGTCLFLMPCGWAAWQLFRSRSSEPWLYRTAFLLLMAELYCLATFAMIYFPPYWFALGICLRAAWHRRFCAPESRASDAAPKRVRAAALNLGRTRARGVSP